jgi:hypothetical protein
MKSDSVAISVCAWCDRFLGVRSPDAAALVSHSICKPCATRYRWIEAPIIVVSKKRADFAPVLEEVLRGASILPVIVDRRLRDRRARELPSPTSNRRSGADRRQGSTIALF